MTAWRKTNGALTFAHGNSMATITPDGSRFRLLVRCNGKATIDELHRSLSAAQTIGERAAKGEIL